MVLLVSFYGSSDTKLHQTEKLDKAALWVLEGLAKLDRPQLTSLEEKLLRVIEDFYL